MIECGDNGVEPARTWGQFLQWRLWGWSTLYIKTVVSIACCVSALMYAIEGEVLSYENNKHD